MKIVGITTRFAAALTLVATLVFSLGCDNPVSFLQILLSSPLQNSASGLIADGGQETESTPTFPPAEDLIKDWEKPAITLFVSGRLHGYIEPCGCTGLDKQKGGLLRRRTCQKILLNRGWDLVSIDAGNQIRRVSQQAKLKLRTTYEALCKTMDYSAVGLGVDDLKLPAVDMFQIMADVVEEESPFVCANVQVLDDTFSKPFTIVNKNGKKIGITMAVGDEHLASIANNDGLEVKTVSEGLSAVARPMLAQKCDLNILLLQSAPENCKVIANKFPIFDLIITSGGAGDPTLQPVIVNTGKHTTQIIQVGVKGMYAGIIGIYEKNGTKSLKYERVPMDARFVDAVEMRQAFLEYQNNLKLLWEQGALEDIKPRRHPSGHKFVGSAVCADCHDAEFDIWESGIDGNGGPHEKATRDLTEPGERTWVKRNFDPECVSCHAVGWNPQEYFPYQTGFTDIEAHDHLTGNGCENCHGPGSAHVESEESGEESEELRKQMIVTKAEAKATLCLSCHDLDNSPDYALADDGFEKFWPAIAHGEDDDE